MHRFAWLMLIALVAAAEAASATKSNLYRVVVSPEPADRVCEDIRAALQRGYEEGQLVAEVLQGLESRGFDENQRARADLNGDGVIEWVMTEIGSFRSSDTHSVVAVSDGDTAFFTQPATIAATPIYPGPARPDDAYAFDPAVLIERGGRWYVAAARDFGWPSDDAPLEVHRIERDFSQSLACAFALDFVGDGHPAIEVRTSALGRFDRVVAAIAAQEGEMCGSLHSLSRRHANRTGVLDLAIRQPWRFERNAASNAWPFLDAWATAGTHERKLFDELSRLRPEAVRWLARFYHERHGLDVSASEMHAHAAIESLLDVTFEVSIAPQPDRENRKADDELVALQRALASAATPAEAEVLHRAYESALAALPQHARRLPAEPLLFLATSNTALVDWLIARGARVDEPNPFGKTALMQAAQDGRPDAVAALLRHGADIATRTHLPQDRCTYTLTTADASALHYAARYASASIVRMLIEAGADPAARDNHRRTPLDWALRFRPKEDAERAQIVELLEPPSLRERIRRLNAIVGEGIPKPAVTIEVAETFRQAAHDLMPSTALVALESAELLVAAGDGKAAYRVLSTTEHLVGSPSELAAIELLAAELCERSQWRCDPAPAERRIRALSITGDSNTVMPLLAIANVEQPVCEAHPGGRTILARFGWRSISTYRLPDRRHLLVVGVRDTSADLANPALQFGGTIFLPLHEVLFEGRLVGFGLLPGHDRSRTIAMLGAPASELDLNCRPEE